MEAMNTKPEALRLADELDGLPATDFYEALGDEAAAELRRLHAENERLHQINQSHELKLSVRGYELQIEDLRQANEAFGKRQEWWNERMFALEKQRDELLEALEDVMDRLVDRHETDEAAVAARAAIARAEGKQ